MAAESDQTATKSIDQSALDAAASIVANEMHRETMDVVMNDDHGVPQLFTACYDRRTGMPSKYYISVRHKDILNLDVEVYDCLPVSTLKKMIAAKTNGHASELILWHDGIKLTGNIKLGFYGVGPDSVLSIKRKGRGKKLDYAKANGVRNYKLSGNPMLTGNDLVSGPHDKDSYLHRGEGMLTEVSKPIDLGATMHLNTTTNVIKMPQLAVHTAYGNNAPPSPTDCRLGARSVPLPTRHQSRQSKKTPKFQV